VFRRLREGGRLGTEEIEQTGTPVHANQLTIFSDPSSFSAAFESSSRVHEKSPKSCIKLRTPYGSKVPKIIIDIAKLPAAEDGESELLTPQKKLLHSITQTASMLARHTAEEVALYGIVSSHSG